MQLANRVAIITGAGRGIGRAIALTYAKEGAKLALAARTQSELEETAQQSKALGAEALVIPPIYVTRTRWTKWYGVR
jgi:3-oxoacyl-[acyl-carrier protein] reductase